ncbi:NAD-binding protein [Planomicrobium soli]|nr:NAD-binding protein [Planomicrobium soli]
MYEGKKHIVIIDWSHKAENAMKEILERDQKVDIVVIDTIEKAKQVNERIHFIRGAATDPDVLRKANVQHAKAVLIFSDDKIEDQMLTDGKSLMIACAVERISPGVHTTVEIEREEHIPNFSHIKVDNFILSNATIAKLAVDSIL